MEGSSYLRWLKWGNTSPEALRTSEESILRALRTPYEGQLVNLGKIIDQNESHVWTIILNPHLRDTATPIVLIHGLGSGVALWAKNLDQIASRTSVYAFDLLGFGRSSRTVFSTNAGEAEGQWVHSIEVWRQKMGLERFILLGHSLGGFLATAYTLNHPNRVAHLILADPWGFNKQPADLKEIGHIPLHHRIIVRMMEPLNPLWAIRAAGPLGPKFIQRIRADLIKQFQGFLEEPVSKISSYIYHCNAQSPTGEEAFHAMMVKFGWAKNPMYLRIPALDAGVDLTIINGALSWVDHYPIEKIKEMRPESSVEFHVLQYAGHHLYADMSEEFNGIILHVSSIVDGVPLSSKSVTDTNQNLVD